MAQQEIWDKPQHLTEMNSKVAVDRGLRLDRQGSGEAREGVDMKVWGVTRSGKGEQAHVEENFCRGASCTKRCRCGLRVDLRAGNSGNKNTSSRGLKYPR